MDTYPCQFYFKVSHVHCIRSNLCLTASRSDQLAYCLFIGLTEVFATTNSQKKKKKNNGNFKPKKKEFLIADGIVEKRCLRVASLKVKYSAIGMNYKIIFFFFLFLKFDWIQGRHHHQR